ncbi:MAG: hypothetical protein ACPGOV_14525 [Magnetovibrionaceae bacterium]
MGVGPADDGANAPLRNGMRALIALAAVTREGPVLLDAMETAFAFVEARSDELQAHGPKKRDGKRACCAWLHVQATALEILAVSERARLDLTSDQQRLLIQCLKGTTQTGDASSGQARGRLEVLESSLFRDLMTGQNFDDLLAADGLAGGEMGVETGDSIHAGALLSRSMTTAARDGLRLGLTDAGLDSSLFNFGMGLMIALETHDATARWMAGEDLFAPARVPTQLI